MVIRLLCIIVILCFWVSSNCFAQVDTLWRAQQFDTTRPSLPSNIIFLGLGFQKDQNMVWDLGYERILQSNWGIRAAVRIIGPMPSDSVRPPKDTLVFNYIAIA